MGLINKAKGAALAVALKLALKYVKGDKEYGPMLSKFLKFMDGKKTISGFALLALPAVVGAAASAAVQAGVDPILVAKYTAWASGTLLAVLGIVHRLVKWADDQTPDVPPTQ